MKNSITSRQNEVLGCIEVYISKNGIPPSVSEITDMMEFSSLNATSDHLKALVKKGYIERTPRIARGIKVVKPSEIKEGFNDEKI